MFVYDNICPDDVIFGIKDTTGIFITPHIAPESSVYKQKGIFAILKHIVKKFQTYDIYLLGDLNARCSTPSYSQNDYRTNPDKFINQNGRNLLKLCKENGLTITNGLLYNNRYFDTDFTFFRGSRKSQNDWCVTNHIQTVQSFPILPKLTLSDHRPRTVTLKIQIKPSLQTIEKFAKGMFTYDHCDKSRKVRRTMNISSINVPNVMKKPNEVAEKIINEFECYSDINSLAAKIENAIYDSCYANRNMRNTHQEKQRIKILSTEKSYLTSAVQLPMLITLDSKPFFVTTLRWLKCYDFRGTS